MSRIDNMAEIQRLVSERVEEERREQEPASMPDYDKRTAAVEELNQIHAVIMIGGTCRILNEFTDPTWNRPEINFSTVNDFYNRYSNRKIMVPGKRKGNAGGLYAERLYIDHSGSAHLLLYVCKRRASYDKNRRREISKRGCLAAQQ